MSSSWVGQLLTFCGEELPCWERFFWDVAAQNHATIGLCRGDIGSAISAHLAVRFTDMQIMEPLFVAISGTYESQLMHPYGPQCHTARAGGGGVERSYSGSLTS